MQLSRPAVINTNDRAAVIASYDAEFNRAEPAMNWTGDVSKCDGGTTSEAYQLSILQRVNWHRAMAGLADVTYRSDLNAQQQAGALISAANSALSHTPASTAKCWTQTGYDGTSSSNLYLGVNGINAMTGYVEDPGANNYYVGHRRWVLSPKVRTVTSGDIPEGTGHMKANALHVFDFAGTFAQTPRDGHVSWPPPGYVPDDVVFPRWSSEYYQYTGYTPPDYRNATVTVTGPDGPLAVTIEHQATGAVVFTPAGFENAPVQVTADRTYTVSISGLTGGGVSSYSYNVTLVPTNSAPYENGTSSYGADACAVKNKFTDAPMIRDKDGDTFTVDLVAGEGDTDNALFTMVKSGSYWYLRTNKDLDGTRTKFSVRYRATDSRGAAMERVLALTLKDPPAGGCPKKTSTTVPDGGTGGTTVSRRTVSGTITRGRTRSLSSFAAMPTGNRTYRVTGRCRLSSTKKSVIAPKSKGSCTVTVTGRTSLRTSIVTVKLRVK